MELYQLKYFVAVVRERNFTRAAERLHLAQPALSEEIRSLEQELGAQLFVRGSRTIVLSETGKIFYPHVQRLLAQAAAAKESVAEAAQLKRGRLVLASIPAVSACWLPPRMRRFRQKYPEIELVLREETSEGVARLVEEAGAELGFLQSPVQEDRFDIREILT